MSFFNPRFLNLCDAELKTEDGDTFQVHRIILAMKSKYFSSIFCGMNAMNEDRRQFKIPGISGNCLREILKYIYTGDIFDTEQQESDLLYLDLIKAADSLCLQDLHLQIRQRLTKVDTGATLTTPNCLSELNTAYNIKNEGITRKSFRSVEIRFEEILRTQMKDLTELSLEVFEKILGSRSLNVTSERTVWLSIVEWAKNNIESRSEYVPRLLMCLARKELDENLAQEILQHQIVSENTFMEKLNEFKYSSDFSSHLDALFHFLENYSNSIKQPLYYRCPPRLHVISCPDRNGNMYITYDEQMDLWRQISETTKGLSEFPTMRTVVVGRHFYLFIFNSRKPECKKFDIITQQWMPMSTFPKETRFTLDVYVFEVDGYIYIIRTLDDPSCVRMQLYDTLNDRWFDEGSLKGFDNAKAVTLNKKIYFVGISPYEDENDGTPEMMARMFDTLTERWEVLPPPKVCRFRFEVLPCHEKVYVIGGCGGNCKPIGNVEVFDPETNLWTELPPVPFPRHREETVGAVVLNEQILVYSMAGFEYSDFQTVHNWNELENQWKVVHDKSSSPFRILFNGFSTVTDKETIQTLTKVNRHRGISWQKDV